MPAHRSVSTLNQMLLMLPNMAFALAAELQGITGYRQNQSRVVSPCTCSCMCDSRSSARAADRRRSFVASSVRSSWICWSRNLRGSQHRQLC